MVKVENIGNAQNRVNLNDEVMSPEEICIASIFKGLEEFSTNSPDKLLEHLRKYPDVIDYLKENI